MSTLTRPSALLLAALITVLLSATPNQTIAAEEIGSVVETFGCSFHPGKNFDDLDAAVEMWSKDVKAVPALDSYFAAVIRPVRANATRDFFWLGQFPSLNAFGQGLTATFDTPAGRKALSHFADVADCGANTWLNTELYAAYEAEANDPGYEALQIYVCNLNDGRGMNDVETAEQAYVKEAKSRGLKLIVERWNPYMVSGLDADLVYLVVHQSYTTMARDETNWHTSTAGMASNERFANAMTCSAGLYSGRVVKLPVDS